MKKSGPHAELRKQSAEKPSRAEKQNAEKPKVPTLNPYGTHFRPGFEMGT